MCSDKTSNLGPDSMSWHIMGEQEHSLFHQNDQMKIDIKRSVLSTQKVTDELRKENIFCWPLSCSDIWGY